MRIQAHRRHYYRATVFCVAISWLLSGCAGSLFGSGTPKQAEDLEEVGNRRATEPEEKRLDECLHYIFKRQQAVYARDRKYVHDIRALKPEEHCGKIKLSMETTLDGFTAAAKIRDGDTTVKWTVNEKGEVVEHDDMSFDFSL